VRVPVLIPAKVSSEVHAYIPTLPDTPTLLADLDSKERTDAAGQTTDLATKQLAMAARYPRSKLLEVVVVRELVKRLDSRQVVVATANPGLCHSGLARDYKGFAAWRFWLFKYISVSSSKRGRAEVARADC
jgi:hypothetical protein